MKVKCETCGKIHKKSPCEVKKYKHHYCSKKCHGKGWSKIGSAKGCKVDGCNEKHRGLGFCLTHYHKERYENNKDKILDKNKIWCKKNKEKISERQKKWREDNKEKITAQKKIYYKVNRKKISEREKIYYKTNKEKKKVYTVIYEQINKEKIRTRKLFYFKANKKKILNYRYEWRRKKYKTDPIYRLHKIISSAIWESLKENKNGRCTEKLLGYAMQSLKKHLEALFTPKMTWQNHGSYWELHHITPLSWFKGASEEIILKKAWALKNLMPLEKSENRARSNKLILEYA